MQVEEYAEIITDIVKAAGRLQLDYFGSNLKVAEKKSSFDLVTTADFAVEKLITSRIKEYFSDHNILAEEQKYPKTASPYCWVIDPIDGTNNFALGLPIFCTSVALAYKGEVIGGFIYDPIRDELFSAYQGAGAYLNSKPIKVSQAQTLDKSLLITGFYYDRGYQMRQTLSLIDKFFQKNIVGIRRLGSAALDLCYVACGRVAGFWEFKLSPWDFAAGKLLVEEAGGKITDNKGERLKLEESFVVASNSKIHPFILETINQ
jgi:myo-inositol-1(or 4)-monophosphatase